MTLSWAICLALLGPEPAAADAYRFAPCREAAAMHVRAAVGYSREHVERLADWQRPAAWQRQSDVARAWLLVQTALDDGLSAEARLRSLIDLHRLIGAEAYAAGRLPGPYPDATDFPRP